jgi:hypothetical protein
VTYIHDNAVAAGLVADPAAHVWSSAWHLSMASGNQPLWLSTSWVDEEIAARGRGESPAEQLAAAFPSNVDREFRAWIESQLSARLPDEVDDVTLKHAGSPRVVRWALRKTKLADGTRPWRPVCPPNLVERVLRRARRETGPLLGHFARRSKDAWHCLRAGLLRLLSGCTHAEIGLRLGRHGSTSSRDVKDHARLLQSVSGYEALSCRLTDLSLRMAR